MHINSLTLDYLLQKMNFHVFILFNPAFNFDKSLLVIIYTNLEGEMTFFLLKITVNIFILSAEKEVKKIGQ